MINRTCVPLNLTILMIFLLWTPASYAAQIVWKGAQSSLWSAPQNWTPMGVPGESDTVVFDNTAAGSCFVDSNESIAFLTVNGFIDTLMVAGNVTLTIGQNLIQHSGNLRFESASAALAVRGDMTFAGGLFVVVPGIIEMAGSLPQTITGAYGTWDQLIINNRAGVNLPLSHPLNVTHLTLTSGILSTNDTIIVTASSAGNDSSYVNGAMEKYLPPFTTTIVPVGNNGYSPLTFHVTAGSGLAAITAIRVVPPNVVDSTDVLRRYWSLAAAPGITADLTLKYPAGDVPPTATESAWTAGSSDSVVWTILPVASRDLPRHTATVNAVSTFPRMWTLGGAPALPIEMSNLTGAFIDGRGVILAWSTITESNSLGFYAERRSEHTSIFQSISGLIAGAGSSLERHGYSFIDTTVMPGLYYYRLKQVDQNGSLAYSAPIQIVVDGTLGDRDTAQTPGEFRLEQNYPNPFNPATEVGYRTSEFGFVTIRVFDILGREVTTLVNEWEAPGTYRTAFNGSSLASGIYYYRLEITRGKSGGRVSKLGTMTLIR